MASSNWLTISITAALFLVSCVNQNGKQERQFSEPTEVPSCDEPEPPKDANFNRLGAISYEQEVTRITTFYDNDVYASDYVVAEGEVYGNHVEWHPNGTIQRTGAMFQGKRIGLWLEFDEEGKLVSEVVYKSGTVVKRSP